MHIKGDFGFRLVLISRSISKLLIGLSRGWKLNITVLSTRLEVFTLTST